MLAALLELLLVANGLASKQISTTLGSKHFNNARLFDKDTKKFSNAVCDPLQDYRRDGRGFKSDKISS